MTLNLEQHFVEKAPSNWRKEAILRFNQVGLPNRQDEAFGYLPFSQLYKENFGLAAHAELTKEEVAKYRLPECAGQFLVFANGKFRPDLSEQEAIPSQIVILPFKEAMGPYGQFLQARLMRSLKEEKDPFALLNAATFEQGLFIYVPPKIRLEKPIQCIHLTTGEEPALLTARLQLFIGSESELDLITQTFGEGGHLIADVVDVALEERAQLRQWQLLLPSSESWIFSSGRATLKQESSYKVLTYTRGAQSVRQDFQFSLQGENSSVELRGLAQLEENHQAHVNVTVDHRAPHTRSEQLYKQILDDVAQGSFMGRILVQPIAQKTQAYQLNKNLILGARAQAFSKPNLEIFADDVKASHGATVSQLDETELFYLKTRGLSDLEARQLLTEGFSREILSQIPFESLQKIIYGL